MTLEQALKIVDPDTCHEALAMYAGDCDMLRAKAVEASRMVVDAYKRARFDIEYLASWYGSYNGPLSIEELKNMDEQPVYVTQPGHESCWALVYGFWAAQGIIYLTYFNGATDLVEVILNNGAKIYRRPPKEDKT